MKQIILALTLLIASTGFSQNKTAIGLRVANGYSDIPYESPYNSWGISIEHPFSKHWGFETGYQFNVLNDDNSFTATKFNSIPLGLKYYSSLINISGGGNLNIFRNYQITFTNASTYYVPSLNWYGLYAAISKDIHLTNKLILEPGVQLNYDSYTYGPTYGVNMRLKYTL